MKGLVRLAGIAALAYFGWKLFESTREEFMGLTETEAKVKLKDKLAPRVGEETAEQIAEQVIPKLREKGMLQPDPA